MKSNRAWEGSREPVDEGDGLRPWSSRGGQGLRLRKEEPDLSGLSVLLAEDRPERRQLADRLKGLGAEVTLECSGRAAFAAAMRRLWGGKSFDAVVLDLRQDPVETPAIAAALRDGHFEGSVIAVVGGAERAPAGLWRKAAFTGVAGRSHPEVEVPTLLGE